MNILELFRVATWSDRPLAAAVLVVAAALFIRTVILMFRFARSGEALGRTRFQKKNRPRRVPMNGFRAFLSGLGRVAEASGASGNT